MHIYFNIRKTPSLNKKIYMRAYIINMHRITLNMHKIVLLQMVSHLKVLKSKAIKYRIVETKVVK